MNQSKEILSELQSLSPMLANIPRVNVFRVPDNYFLSLADKMTVAVFLHFSGKNKKNVTVEPSSVPLGYFDSLSNNILTKIKAEAKDGEEEEDVFSEKSFLFPSLKNINVFKVPEGYFKNLPMQVMEKIKQPASAKIIPITKNWWKYAAAAVVAGIITISTIQLFNYSIDNQNSIGASLQYKTPQQLDKGIASLSDDEIVNYLQKHGNILDVALLTKDVDVSALPSSIDYLLDENALDDYLDNIDAKINY